MLIAADLLTKYYAKLQLWDVAIIPGWVELNGYVKNNGGCAFSFLDDNPQIGQPIFITLTFIMLALLIALFIFMPERFTALKISVTFIAAGAAGNVVDRLAFRSVRDFFGLNMLFNGNLVYCNLADFFVVIGAVIAVIDMLFLNEFAVIPLTKRAKAAQSAKKQEEESKTSALSRAENDGGNAGDGPGADSIKDQKTPAVPPENLADNGEENPAEQSGEPRNADE